MQIIVIENNANVVHLKYNKYVLLPNAPKGLAFMLKLQFNVVDSEPNCTVMFNIL